MKKIWKIILSIGTVLILIVVALVVYFFTFAPFICTLDASSCEDGSTVGRSGASCKFEECPQVQNCVQNSDCLQGYECIKFSNKENFICYSNDILSDYAGLGCELVGEDPKEFVCPKK